VRFLSN